MTLRIARSRDVDHLGLAADEVRALKDEKTALDARLSAAQERLVALMLADGRKSVHVGDGQHGYRATLVESKTLEVNEPGLRKALSAPVFDRLCDLRLNRRKLEKAVAEELIDARVVAIYTSEVPKTPYVRFSKVVEE
jgi:hypothetical protein